MDDIQKTNRRRSRTETVLSTSLPVDNKGNMSLYLGASAFFISTVSAFLLYREITKIKKSLGDVKQMKNQLTNMDSRFEDMDDQLKKVLNIIQNKAPIQIPVQRPQQMQIPPNQPSFDIPLNLRSVDKQSKLEVVSISSEDVDGEDESDSDNDSEISYVSDDVSE